MEKLHDWTECDLWKALESRQDAHSQDCRTTLSRIMPKIQAVLASGGTSPKDFTLHDAGHSFRVAQRMRAIAGDACNILSSFELSLLFLSAYLHDIGMTPEFKKVNAHYTYLLTGDRPRLVGEPAAVVSLRFLALVLRMADILEFDPERTPDVILRHRDIAPESQIYWWKDKAISLTMADGRIVVSARPPSAKIHKAIDDMVDAIDTELAMCRTLADEFPLGAVPGLAEPLPYQWTLLSGVHRDITPREGAYEYIDGAFRPDTKKLLSLLSGTSLYQDPLMAVRELVQNAFDAVSERIAHQRLAQPNPASPNLARQLAKQHRVSLQLETRGPDAYLVCTDSGIGMTKAIIRDRVLVSGSGPRHDVQALDRRCKEAGFQLGRSGQFGIGILSYFMLATQVEIETQRAQEAGDSDSTTWYFETEGIGSFGELRNSRAKRPGSQVRLRLKPEISSNLAAWYRSLRPYLLHTLVQCPCQFYLSSPIPECEPLELEPGWCPRDYAAVALSGLRRRDDRTETPIDLLSSMERELRLATERETDDLENEFRSQLRWHSEQGTLSDGTGEYLILLPYFELEGGPSLAFLRSTRLRKNITVYRFLNATHYLPLGHLEEAWKGMAFWGPPLNWRLRNVFCRDQLGFGHRGQRHGPSKRIHGRSGRRSRTA